MTTLLLGTANPGKAAEFAELLAVAGLRLLSLADVASPPAVAEDAVTPAEIAAHKASVYGRHSGLWTLADDTVLEVDALGGAPGIHTARYAGPQASPAENRRRLLDELAAVPPQRRTARFVCHLALADPQGQVRATSQGHCRGRIRSEPAGSQGFGYDALFEIVEYHLTLAELGLAATSVLGHRGQAVRKLLPEIVGLVKDGVP